MGLLVDKPRDTGRSTSNDGKTATTVFSNPRMASEITVIDKDLITRFAMILQPLASENTINIKKFGTYALDRSKKLINIYLWNCFLATVHKNFYS